MTDLQFFTHDSKQVRTIEKGDGTWWVLKDVCDVLKIENPKDVSKRMDDDEVGRFDLPHPQSPQKTLEMVCINESGLYNVILRSDKPEAKPFRKWVTSEVLPAIHKHGMYAVDQLLENPDLAIKAFTALKEERQLRKLAESEKEKLQIELDYSKEWFSIKRVAHKNNANWKAFDWRKLKSESERMGCGVKKIFDANYGEVNTYHCKVWESVYPHYEI